MLRLPPFKGDRFDILTEIEQAVQRVTGYRNVHKCPFVLVAAVGAAPTRHFNFAAVPSIAIN